MQHRRSRLRLNAKPDHRRLLERNLVTSLILYESIRTTRKRAKVIQPIIDRLIAVSKRETTHVAIRSLNRVVLDKNASRKLMEVLRERFKNRPSGFTRIKPAGSRKGDGAQLVDLSFVELSKPATPAEKGKKERKAKVAPKKEPKAKAAKDEKDPEKTAAPVA